MRKFDIVLLTASKYLHVVPGNEYIQNIFTEDILVMNALKKKGFTILRTHWNDPEFDWTDTRYAIFRTTWDYFDRFAEFKTWLETAGTKTTFINPLSLIKWNMDKHYLLDLKNQGIRIPPTFFIEPNDSTSLKDVAVLSGWSQFILKPAVSGAARHTYRFDFLDVEKYQDIYRNLISKESMLLQEFLVSVPVKGEVGFIVINGRCTHAVLKKAKAGDFRVQDDFGGTVHDYYPSPEEISFVEKVVALCQPAPVYARVDIIWDNQNLPCVSELELIEPELWFRKNPLAADLFATGIAEIINHCKNRADP